MMERKIYYPLFVGMFLAIMVFSPPMVFAQQDPQPAVLPDSFFYNFKLAVENFQEFITTQDERKAELLLKQVEERDREAEALERMGKFIPIDRLKAIQAEKIAKAEQIILRLENTLSFAQQQEQERADRNQLLQARTEAERVLLLQEQQDQRDQRGQPQFIEPSLKPQLIEGQIQQRAIQTVQIFPVEDITDEDEPSTIVQKLRDRLQNSFSISEITEIRARFSELRLETDFDRKRFLADQLDNQVNNPIISISCFGRVDTFALSVAIDPIDELQEQCPILRPIPDEELARLANSVG